jgi:UDP-glucose 4-epimerase
VKEDRPVVLVTGASGFIGRHLAPILEGAGWTVRRALRKPVMTPGDVCIESIGAGTDWKDALVGVDAVVHLAARVRPQRDEQAVELIAISMSRARCILRAAPRTPE